MKKSKWSVIFPSLQPNIEKLFTDDSFNPATENEKENFIETKESVTYWQEAWRRFKANKVAMISLIIICLLYTSRCV